MKRFPIVALVLVSAGSLACTAPDESLQGDNVDPAEDAEVQRPLDATIQDEGAACAPGTEEDEDGQCVTIVAGEPDLLANDARPAYVPGVEDPIAIGDTQALVADPYVDAFGVKARTGQLRAKKSSRLYATINVRKTAWGWSGNSDQVYRKSRNRTQKGPRLDTSDGGRRDINHEGTVLMIHDPSCTAGNPCTGNDNPFDPTDVMYKEVSKLSSCYLAPVAGETGTFSLRYVLASDQTAGGTKPQWVNRVFFYNNCKKAFSVVRSHTFRAAQKDCSVDNSCGNAFAWNEDHKVGVSGPSSSSSPNTLIWSSMKIKNDGVTSALTDANTAWTAPQFNWAVKSRTSNSAFVVQHK